MNLETLISHLPGVLIGIAAVVSAMRGVTKRIEARLDLIELHLTNHIPHQLADMDRRIETLANCECKEPHGSD